MRRPPARRSRHSKRRRPATTSRPRITGRTARPGLGTRIAPPGSSGRGLLTKTQENRTGVMTRKLRLALVATAGIAALAAGGYWGVGYWQTGRFLQSTDDAYLQADYTTIAPKVSGYIAEVLVADNQPVKAGEVLARIDDRDFRNALDQRRAEVASGEADMRNIEAQIAQQQAVIEQARAAVASDQAGLTFARQNATRYRDLMQTGYGTTQAAQQTASVLQQQN